MKVRVFSVERSNYLAGVHGWVAIGEERVKVVVGYRYRAQPETFVAVVEFSTVCARRWRIVDAVKNHLSHSGYS